MLLEARGLTKIFGDLRAVDEVSLSLQPRETLALIGPSGCGKTTLLRMLNRLEEPDAGQVFLAGDAADAMPAPLWRRRMGFVVQSAGLFPHMTVAQNVSVTPRLLGWEDARISRKVDELLDMAGLDPSTYRSRRPAELSGGQRQRVGLARALAGEPELVLMDEPFSALDPETKEGLIDQIRAMREALGFAAVIVTHDFGEALALADQIAVMQAGRIMQCAPARELINNPASPEIATLLDAPRRAAERIAAVFGEPHVK